jgi:mono/diheme cytochrome c family protein
LTAWLIGLASAVVLAQDADHGEQLAGLGGCAGCHTEEGGPAYGGGYGIETSFGTFYGSNISPEPTTGIGSWSNADFIRAMRLGRSPSGRPYAPAFPYASFTGMTDSDLLDLFAYLKSQERVVNENREHDVSRLYGGRFAIGYWRISGFKMGPFEAETDRSAAWNRGAYLSEAVGHCGECHTPRNKIGVPKKGKYLAGNREPPEQGPNITPHPEGLEAWSESDWSTLLELGMLPDGDFVGGPMGELIEHGTSRLTEADRAAMVEYLRSVPPKPSTRSKGN